MFEDVVDVVEIPLSRRPYSTTAMIAAMQIEKNISHHEKVRLDLNWLEGELAVACRFGF